MFVSNVREIVDYIHQLDEKQQLNITSNAFLTFEENKKIKMIILLISTHKCSRYSSYIENFTNNNSYFSL